MLTKRILTCIYKFIFKLWHCHLPIVWLYIIYSLQVEASLLIKTGIIPCTLKVCFVNEILKFYGPHYALHKWQMLMETEASSCCSLDPPWYSWQGHTFLILPPKGWAWRGLLDLAHDCPKQDSSHGQSLLKDFPSSWAKLSQKYTAVWDSCYLALPFHSPFTSPKPISLPNVSTYWLLFPPLSPSTGISLQNLNHI